jgi:hypothetical protein
MSLTQRKARPIRRENTSLRDDRLFLIACDDTYAPHQYFGFFKLARIQVQVVPTVDGTSVAKYVLDRLREYELEPHDERWLLPSIPITVPVGTISPAFARRCSKPSKLASRLR